VPGKIKSTLDLIIKNSFIELRMMLKEMKISSRLKGGIYEVSFGYHSKLEGYATLMSDILELYEMAVTLKWKHQNI
jgi:hypothetical protein